MCVKNAIYNFLFFFSFFLNGSKVCVCVCVCVFYLNQRNNNFYQIAIVANLITIINEK